MHNLGNEFFQSEMEYELNPEQGYELSPEFELNEYEQSYSSESAGYELSPEFEFENTEFETTQYEENEMQLAQELSQVSNELEFANWLKRTAKKTIGAAANLLNTSAGQQATAALSAIAQKTLPKVGGWLGGKVPGASSLGQAAGRWAGGKLSQAGAERLPSFVKLATDTLRNMSNEFEAGRNPVAKPAIVKAAAKHYPIILNVKGTLYGRREKDNNGNGTNAEFEFNTEMYNEFEQQGEINQEGTFNEVTEMQLASELLSINNESELDQFLGKLFKKATGAVSKLAKSPLGGMLKGIAKKALPIAGGALGTFIAPGIGTAIGGALGNTASNLFELELEGMSPEDREFEIARAYVRFAGNAARRASRSSNRNTHQAARQAVVQSARRYAPGLLRRSPRYRYGGGSYPNMGGVANDMDNTSGTWYRDGNNIILQGV